MNEKRKNKRQKELWRLLKSLRRAELKIPPEYLNESGNVINLLEPIFDNIEVFELQVFSLIDYFVSDDDEERNFHLKDVYGLKIKTFNQILKENEEEMKGILENNEFSTEEKSQKIHGLHVRQEFLRKLLIRL